MASTISDPNGRKRIAFINPDGTRKAVRLGKFELRDAEAVRVKIERILSAAILRQPLDKQTSEWLLDLGDDLHGKLAAAGLVKPRQGRALSVWLESYKAARADLKPESLRKIAQTCAKLLAHFKGDKPLHEITPEDATAWRDAMKAAGLSDAAVKTHVGNAKTIFAEAKRLELIARSPVEHLKGGVTATSNTRYVSPEDVEKLLAACPDSEWRLLFGLARYAGLRTPSETHLLTWADVDFDAATLRVKSPKTERHKGHEQRLVPICPRLMKLLDERFAAAEDGDTHLVKIKGAGSRRRKVLAIVERANVEAWDDTWQTLRRSCEIEWASTHPQYAVSRWIGHSIAVSGKHYANSVPAELFAKVTGKPMPGRAAQNAAQQDADSTRTEAHEPMPAAASISAKSGSSQTLRNDAAHSEKRKKWSRGESNPRPDSPDACKNRPSSDSAAAGDAQSGALGAADGPKTPSDPDLVALVTAWPTLPPAIKAAMLALAKAGGGAA